MPVRRDSKRRGGAATDRTETTEVEEEEEAWCVGPAAMVKKFLIDDECETCRKSLVCKK